MVNREESIWTKYRHIVEENKEKRRRTGDWNENEAEELIFDKSYEGGGCVEDEGGGVEDNGGCVEDADGGGFCVPWQFTNLLSARWLQDFFGVDWFAVQKLMSTDSYGYGLVIVDDVLYYRESSVLRVLEVLRILAKSTIVNTLRPIPQIIKEVDEPLYTSKDMMRLLNVKESTLSKLRNNFELGYTRFGDKILYTQKDLMDFIYNPKHRVEAV